MKKSISFSLYLFIFAALFACKQDNISTTTGEIQAVIDNQTITASITETVRTSNGLTVKAVTGNGSTFFIALVTGSTPLQGLNGQAAFYAPGMEVLHPRQSPENTTAAWVTITYTEAANKQGWVSMREAETTSGTLQITKSTGESFEGTFSGQLRGPVATDNESWKNPAVLRTKTIQNGRITLKF